MAINSKSFSQTAVNENGNAYSQGVQDYELLVANSESIGYRALGSFEINGNGIAVDLRPQGEGEMLSLTQRVIRKEATGSLFDLEQNTIRYEAADDLAFIQNNTFILGSGNLFQLYQSVELRAVVDAPEQIASFDQTIARAEASGSVFYLSQRVRDLSVSTQQYKPFEIDLVATSPTTGEVFTVTDAMLHGDIEITRAENDASILTFSILVPEGDVTDYVEKQGFNVTLDYTDNATGKTDRLYTGQINIPEIDFIRGVATYRCSDNRREAINALDGTTVSQYGYWSQDVFGEKPDEIFDEVEQRLETIPYAFDMTRYGGLRLVQWEPKAVADKVLTDSSVFRRQPRVEVLSRGRVVNRVNIDMEFQYPRLRYREQPYAFYPPNSVCEYFSIGPRVEKAMVHEALAQTTWAYKNMRMTDAACGSSRFCNGSAGSVYTAPCGTYTTYQEPQTDIDGNPVLDADGNQVTKTKIASYTDTSKKYVGTATWTSYIRFAQNISEKISLIVEAPQSIAQYGEVERDQAMGVAIEYDVSDWENMKYEFDLSDFGDSANGDKYLDLAYLSSADGAARWKAAYDCAIERAKTSIIKTHRDNTVNVEVPMIADLELSHTVEIDTTDWTACKGKVGQIRHTINLADKEAITELSIKLSRSIGAPPTYTKPTSDAARPQNRGDAPDTVERITLRSTIIGKNEEITDDMVGAIYRQDRYNVLAGFAVNTPPIEDSRKNREFESSTTIQLPIRNDSLTIRHKR